MKNVFFFALVLSVVSCASVPVGPTQSSSGENYSSVRTSASGSPSGADASTNYVDAPVEVTTTTKVESTKKSSVLSMGILGGIGAAAEKKSKNKKRK